MSCEVSRFHAKTLKFSLWDFSFLAELSSITILADTIINFLKIQ